MSDITHTLGGCPYRELRKIHCQRHDEAVEAIYKAVRTGYKGSATVIRDTGKYEEMDENRKHTLPQYLYREPVGDRRSMRRPDLVVILRVRGDKQLPPQYVPMREREDRRLYLLEVSYTALGGMERREKEKRDKYEETLGGLRMEGWEPELLTLILGTLGEVPTDATELLAKVGVKGESLIRLLNDLHNIAIKRMSECIETDSTYNEQIGYYGDCTTPRERSYDHGEEPNDRARKRTKVETAARRTVTRRRRRIQVTTGKKKGKRKNK